MMRVHWNAYSFHVAAGSVLVLIALGCGGSSGGSTSPTAPTIAEMAGNWTGTYAAESASGCGCVANLLQTIVGVRVPFSMQISQNGATFEGRLTDEEGVWCDLEGTVSSGTFSASFTTCSEPDPGEVECPNGSRRNLVWGHTTVEGTVIGNQMTGTVFEEDECYNSNNGEYIGMVSVQLGIELQRG